jgi:nicotine blue oxidoreductase
VEGLLLAAGAGRRLGTPKALVLLGDRLLVDRGVDLLRNGGCDGVTVVLGAAAAAVRAAGDLSGVRVVEHEDWADGMGSSLRAGLRSLPPVVDGVVVALVDQPLVGAGSVRRLGDALRGGAEAAVATYGGKPRNPVAFARSVWADVMAAATGDTGGRDFVRGAGDRVVRIPCEDVGSPADIDTPDDLAAVQTRSAECS